MSVDWSKAPQSATHFVMSNESGIPGGWYRADGIKMRDIANEGEYTFRLDDLHPQRMLHLIARPTQWTGEGLPPVGTVCEYIGRKHGLTDGAHVEIIHHFHAGSADVAVFIYSQGLGHGRHVAQAVADCFRPIRTPEQIAEEEREQELNRMVATVSMLDKGWARKVCAGLYDAGYRKQVTP